MIVLLLCTTYGAHANDLRFGPEFSLTNNEILNDQPVNISTYYGEDLIRNYFYNLKLREYHTKLVDHLIKKLVLESPPLATFDHYTKIINGEHRHVFRSPNGWSAILGLDMGTLEWTVNPMTTAQWEKYAPEIQHVVFDLPREVGLEPMLFAGGGHINMSLGPFLNDLALLRNFVMDFYNHAELALGVFSYDTNNALSVWLLNTTERQRMHSVFEKLKAPERPADEFIITLQNGIDSYTTDEYVQHFRPTTAGLLPMRTNSMAIVIKRNHFMPMQNILDSYRMEIRSFRPQTSVDVFLRQIQLLEARINYLKTKGSAIEPQSYLEVFYDRPLQDRLFNPPVDPQAALRSFYQYVTESGQRWEDHQDYIWPMWISGGELERFNRSLICEQLLSAAL